MTKRKYYVNPTGRFVIGGPHGDSGLTGRKIIVDTYGGYAATAAERFRKRPYKGRPFGLLCSQIRSEKYRCGRIGGQMRNSACLCYRCGKTGFHHGRHLRNGKTLTAKLQILWRSIFDLRPAAIIRDLDLRRPIYRKTAAYGHFGRTDVDFLWEHLDKLKN